MAAKNRKPWSLQTPLCCEFHGATMPRMKHDTTQIQSGGLPETINIHLTRTCNFGCQYCYAEFAECASSRIPLDQLQRIAEAISSAARLPHGRVRKVNFAGGEPMIYPKLADIIEFCKNLGLVTSLVTNGALLKERVIARLCGSLDICAVSVDSGKAETNDVIGRCGKGFRPDAQFYLGLAQRIRDAGMRFKVNTVVNRLNLSENLGELVALLLPFRWKLFQVKEVIGQNDKTFTELAISVAAFEDFVARNRDRLPSSVAVIPETAEEMTASYAMIAPNGCFFDSSRGHHHYSRPILQAGIMEAFQEVAFDAEKFVKRGGSYE
jgi:radical S-adenosyl methionine domain-containing protein 2